MSRFVSIPAGRDAIEQAIHLRSLGLSYPTIRKVMADYHGCHLTDWSWRYHCRKGGSAPAPRGVPIHEQLLAKGLR
jgi:hypothetical protein